MNRHLRQLQSRQQTNLPLPLPPLPQSSSLHYKSAFYIVPRYVEINANADANADAALSTEMETTVAPRIEPIDVQDGVRIIATSHGGTNQNPIEFMGIHDPSIGVVSAKNMLIQAHGTVIVPTGVFLTWICAAPLHPSMFYMRIESGPMFPPIKVIPRTFDAQSRMGLAMDEIVVEITNVSNFVCPVLIGECIARIVFCKKS